MCTRNHLVAFCRTAPYEARGVLGAADDATPPHASQDVRAQSWACGDGDGAASAAAPLLIAGGAACGERHPALYAAQSAQLLRVAPRGGGGTRALRAHSGRIALLEATPCGASVVTAAWDRTVRVWSNTPSPGDDAMSTAGSSSLSSPPPKVVHALDFGAAVSTALAQPLRRAEGGLSLAAGASDGAIRVAAGFKSHSRVLRGHGARVAALTWCDGNAAAVPDAAGATPGALLSAAADGRVKLWDVEAAACARTWHAPHAEQAGPLFALLLPRSDATSSEARVLAASPRHLLALDARAPGSDAAAVLTFAAAAAAAAAGPGPHGLVTGHADGGARLWDLRKLSAAAAGKREGLRGDGDAIAVLRGHSGAVTSVAADGSKIVTAVRRTDSGAVKARGGGDAALPRATLRGWCARGAAAPRAALPLCGPRVGCAPACAGSAVPALTAGGGGDGDDDDVRCREALLLSSGCRCGVAALAARGGIVAAGAMRGAVVAFDWEESMLPLDGAATSADGAASSGEEDEEGGRFWLRAPGRAEPPPG